MHGYRKKLLQRFPDTPEKVQPPAVLPPQEMPSESDTLRKWEEFSSAYPDSAHPAERKSSDEDLLFLNPPAEGSAEPGRQEKLRRREGLSWSKTALALLLSAVSACAGIGAGVLWMQSRQDSRADEELEKPPEPSSGTAPSGEGKLFSPGGEALQSEAALPAEAAPHELSAAGSAPGKPASEAAALPQELQILSDYSHLELRARNDDRRAFDEIQTIFRDPSHPYREIAGQTLADICILVLSMNLHESLLEVPQESSALSVSYDQFRADFLAAPALARPKLLTAMNASPQFSEAEKVGLLLSVVAGDSSLRTLARACQLLDDRAQIGAPFTDYSKYLEWGKQKGFFKDLENTSRD